jgi:hypothetical protein
VIFAPGTIAPFGSTILPCKVAVDWVVSVRKEIAYLVMGLSGHEVALDVSRESVKSVPFAQTRICPMPNMEARRKLNELSHRDVG